MKHTAGTSVIPDRNYVESPRTCLLHSGGLINVHAKMDSLVAHAKIGVAHRRLRTGSHPMRLGRIESEAVAAARRRAGGLGRPPVSPNTRHPRHPTPPL